MFPSWKQEFWLPSWCWACSLPRRCDCLRSRAWPSSVCSPFFTGTRTGRKFRRRHRLHLCQRVCAGHGFAARLRRRFGHAHAKTDARVCLAICRGGHCARGHLPLVCLVSAKTDGRRWQPGISGNRQREPHILPACADLTPTAAGATAATWTAAECRPLPASSANQPKRGLTKKYRRARDWFGRNLQRGTGPRKST